MQQGFGTEAFYSLLKQAYDRQDQDAMANLLFKEVRSYAFQKLRTGKFVYLPAYEREDAFMHAFLYVMSVIGKYLDNPLNAPGAEGGYSPGSQKGWLYRTVTNGLNRYCDEYVRKTTWEERFLDAETGQLRTRRVSPSSLDQPLGVDSGDTPYTILPEKEPTPEERLLTRERINEVCLAFFEQKNNPETLAAVGFVILNDCLGNGRMSLGDYVQALNGCSVDRVIQEIEELLTRWCLDPKALDGLKKRTEGRVIEGLSVSKLANRKNSIITRLRTNIMDGYGGD